MESMRMEGGKSYSSIFICIEFFNHGIEQENQKLEPVNQKIKEIEDFNS